MPQLPLHIVRRLEDASFEICEVFDAERHTITAALRHNPAFSQTNNSRSSLTRDLVGCAFLKAMSRVGLDARRGTGGACEVLEHVGWGYANIRLRSAERRQDGTYFVKANNASKFGYVDESVIEPSHDFVFGFTIDEQTGLNCFVAPVQGVIEGNPGRLVLGDPIDFDGAAMHPASFSPDLDDTLPGFDEGEEDQDSQIA